MAVFTPYNERPEWKDVSPIPQDDGPNPLVPIAYPSDCNSNHNAFDFLSLPDTNAMNYFRAISCKNELSERALELTTQIINMNPAHYTIWNYRQKILFELKKDLKQELDFIEELAEERSKNYQLWQWVIARFDLWAEELSYLDELLIIDVRNNSAWNHRFFVVFEAPTKPTPELLAKEIEYAKSKIILAPNNQSSWNYLKGSLQFCTSPFFHYRLSILARTPDPISADNNLSSFCLELRAAGVTSPHLFASLVDVSEARARRGDKASLDQGVKACDELAETHDTIRKKYWLYRKQNLMTAF
ncbi:protein farnesyltransferase [Endogone sp. FLAS-F59071]|nr:protein farnesyltransferase [Endogone sp. FLAS-F59071]|eukprot:RUS18681.1 protein farnesyltransferase [Endogone sp. FLAS-F59071]